jgi:hypothetical protein
VIGGVERNPGPVVERDNTVRAHAGGSSHKREMVGQCWLVS